MHSQIMISNGSPENSMSEPKLSENTQTESSNAYLKELASCTKDTSHIIYVVCVVIYFLNTTTYTAYAPPLLLLKQCYFTYTFAHDYIVSRSYISIHIF